MAAMVLLAGSVAAVSAGAQTRTKTIGADEPQKILLWEHGAPGALGTEEIDKPSLSYYAPWDGNPSGTAVIVAPGGS